MWVCSCSIGAGVFTYLPLVLIGVYSLVRFDSGGCLGATSPRPWMRYVLLVGILIQALILINLPINLCCDFPDFHPKPNQRDGLISNTSSSSPTSLLMNLQTLYAIRPTTPQPRTSSPTNTPSATQSFTLSISLIAIRGLRDFNRTTISEQQ